MGQDRMSGFASVKSGTSASVRQWCVISIALVFTAGIMIAMAPQAWAAKKSVLIKLTPEAFVANCKNMGGTISRTPTGGIRCVLPSGTVVDCSFDTTTGDAACEWERSLPPTDKKKLLGDAPPDRLSPGTGTGKPKAPAAPGTIDGTK